MRVDESKYSIAELISWLRDRSLVANKEYQRGGGLWPPAAKSYFIDSILRDFPFPKIYLHEQVDKSLRKPRREIVDGQQRLTTILDFVDDKFALGKNAREFEGRRFSDLQPEEQNEFLAYPVSADVIRNAEKPEILQMFRRMNAYTLPLNEAEKRHSEFFGEFKDWVNRTLDEVGSILVDWQVLTSRQIVRMADAEFIADVALAVEEGVVSTSPAKLKKLYEKYDSNFPGAEEFTARVEGAISCISQELSELQGTYAKKLHIFHSLVCALIHNKFGLPGGQEVTGLPPVGEFFTEVESAVVSIRRLALAHEEKDNSEFPEYVAAASEGGNRAAQRAVRVKYLCRALRGEFA
ncbi:MAG TPA: DUF262 domain-containing protein [Xanthomonadaceae bacterium]|nr:DUF262 domain-containing protein [Xanthomonadaceae bacterium]